MLPPARGEERAVTVAAAGDASLSLYLSFCCCSVFVSVSQCLYLRLFRSPCAPSLRRLSRSFTSLSLPLRSSAGLCEHDVQEKQGGCSLLFVIVAFRRGSLVLLTLFCPISLCVRGLIDVIEQR